MSYNGTNPVSVGATATKTQFDRAFNNAVAIKEGDVALDKVRIAEGSAPTSASGEIFIYYDATVRRLKLSRHGGTYEPLRTAADQYIFNEVFG